MAYCQELDDSKWREVLSINSYVLFIGYLSMAIKGLSFLILTWTTVVLLGGFVSMLQKKDFWCLTFICLVQTAGIFDVYLKEKLSHIKIMSSAGDLVLGSVGVTLPGFNLANVANTRAQLLAQRPESPRLIMIWSLSIIVRLLLGYVLALVQILVFVILVCSLAAIYVSGLLISTGISMWRLIQHDYGGNSDSETNLKPAMDALYYLTLLQGLLFCYSFFFTRLKNKFIGVVATDRDDKDKREVVLTYFRETRIGCEKDPSFARGRNLITHAVDLLTSKSPDDCLSGVRMLYTAMCLGERTLKEARVERTLLGQRTLVGPVYATRLEEIIGKHMKEECATRWQEIIGKHMLMKNLIMSSSSSPVLHKLLQTLDPRGAFDRESRNQGATIVSHLALDIHLEQFPQAIQYIFSLIGSFEEYRLIEPYNRDRLRHKYDSDWNAQASRLPSPSNDANNLREAYEKLVLTGLCILRKLATHENNCKIMSHTQGLLPKIMAPLTSDMIHQFNGGAWSISVVEESLKVLFFLVAAPGETGAQLRREISSNKEAICTMERILSCPDCHINLQKRAIRILIELYMDTKSRETYIKILVDIFADDNKDRSIRKLAGEALAKFSIQGGSNISIILQVNGGDVVGTLTKILLLDDAENSTCRIRAAEILEQMCIHHIQNDESPCELKKHMTNTMPKVLAQILHCGLTKDQLAEEDQVNDIENQCDNPRDNARDQNSSYPHPKKNEDEGEVEMEVDELDNDEEEEFHAPLLSLFVTACDIFITADEDLACQFGAVDTISFPRKLKDMVEANSVPMAHCLRLMKLTCKMVISMMKHRGSYLKEDLESLTEALSSASGSMSLLDISMVFASKDDGTKTTIKPVRSLVSLVKEAKESVDIYLRHKNL